METFFALPSTVAINANISGKADVDGIISEIGRMRDEKSVASAQGGKA